MENCEYKKVNKRELHNSCKFLLRQVLVCCAIWNNGFTTGLWFGAPTVMIPQMRKEANSTDAVTPEMASWISSVFGYAALPWVIILMPVSSRVGRKYPYLFVSTCNLASFIRLYFSTTAQHILLAAIMLGPVAASNVTIGIIIVTEYSSPKNRGLFLTLKSASFNWGIWIANALGTFLHWKIISMFGIICTVANVVTILFWYESPYWLASKNRYEDCSRSHRWLKGKESESERELSRLIRSSREWQNYNRQETIFQITYNTILSQEFYKPILLCMTMNALYNCSGKFVCSIYAIDLIQSITSSESAAYTGMLILDGVTIIAMYIGCVLTKIIRRRTLLISTTSFGIVFLFVLSIYLSLIYFSIITGNKYISITVLLLFAIGISCGPMILATSIYGELVPQKNNTSAMLIIGFFAMASLSTVLRLAPIMFTTFRLHGVFCIYGIVSSILLSILYKYMPETKDKTLLEISEYILGRDKKEDEQGDFIRSVSCANYSV